MLWTVFNQKLNQNYCSRRQYLNHWYDEYTWYRKRALELQILKSLNPVVLVWLFNSVSYLWLDKYLWLWKEYYIWTACSYWSSQGFINILAGGGCQDRFENREHLFQNMMWFCINIDLEHICFECTVQTIRVQNQQCWSDELAFLKHCFLFLCYNYRQQLHKFAFNWWWYSSWP